MNILQQLKDRQQRITDGDFGQRLRDVATRLNDDIAADTYAMLPFNFRAVVIGLLAAAAFIFIFNFFIVWGLRSTFNSHVPDAISDATDSANAVARLIDVGSADEALQPWLTTFVDRDMPAKTILIEGLNSMGSADQPTSGVDSTLQQLATGDIHRSWLFPLQVARTVSSREVIDSLLLQADHWNEGLEAQPDAPLRRDFLEAMAGELLAASRPGVRNLRRINGWCQYLTIVTSATLLVIVVRRAVQIRNWSSVSVERFEAEEIPGDIRRMNRILAYERVPDVPDPQRMMLFQEEVVQMQQQVESEVYDPLGTYTAFLPSLGFIGTVLGMGGALLLADQLFDSNERAVAISRMTEQLGFAFDTTLVSLLCSLIVGLATAWVRRKDSQLRQRWFDAIERTQLSSNVEETLHVAS